jgi:radical SAM superfamily enzyme YgiQ (UPF0313 family)
MAEKGKYKMGKKIKFLMINPTASQWHVDNGKAPSRKTKMFRFSMLSSLYVAASMPSYIDTHIIDEDVEPVDFNTDADLIGISFMTFNAPRAYEIADKFRKEKGKPVIFGGYHPTFMPEEAIKHADAICIGEAENNVPRMIEDFVTRRLKQFYRSEPVDLKGLPIPDRSLIRKSAYITPDALQATRGCPNLCKFCSITAFFKHQFRVRPVNEVIEELKMLGRYIIFMDDNIIGNRAYSKELFAKMIPLKKRWFSQCSIRIASDNELLRLAYASGCRGMFIGLESLSQDNLADCNKNFNKANDYIRAIEKIHSSGIAVYAGVVFGMDRDTSDVFEKTLTFLHEANIDALQATILTPFPGTPLFDDMDRQGRIIDRDWSKYDFNHVVFEPRSMSPEMLNNGHNWVLSRFYSRRFILRRLFRAFGYLSPWIIIRGPGMLNFSYRNRLKANGTFDKGKILVIPRNTDNKYAVPSQSKSVQAV